MEEPADSLTRRELAQKYQVHPTGAVNSWDFKSLIWVELCPFPARLGGGVRGEGPSPYVLTWGSQSLPLHHLKNFLKKISKGRQGTLKKAWETWTRAMEKWLNQNKDQ